MCDLETSRMGAPYIYDISHLRVKWGKFLSLNLPGTDILQKVKVSEIHVVMPYGHVPTKGYPVY